MILQLNQSSVFLILSTEMPVHIMFDKKISVLMCKQHIKHIKNTESHFVIFMIHDFYNKNFHKEKVQRCES